MKKILLTGPPHCGKTTLLNSVVERISNKQGFVTKELIEDSQRVGFELISSTGERATLAHVNLNTPYQVSRYFVDLKTLDSFLDGLSHPKPSQLLYIDEIGRMELFSEKFKRLAELYLDAKNSFIGTITAVYEDDFTKIIKSRNDVEIIEVTEQNRGQLLVQLNKMLA